MIKILPIGDQEYKFETNIYLGAVMILLIIAVISISIFGFDKNTHIYIKCPNTSTPCSNPIYNNFAYCGKIIDYTDPICNKEILQPGESYGKAPPKIIKIFPLLAFIFVLLAFIVNHFYLNKDFSFKKLFQFLYKETEKFEVKNDETKR